MCVKDEDDWVKGKFIDVGMVYIDFVVERV